MEIWKDISWYEWIYQVSNLWNVINIKKVKLLKFSIIIWYKRFYLSKNWKTNKFLAHRLVAQTFIPNLENKPYVNHKDWNRWNNYIENLEWVTAKENVIHSFEKLWRKTIFSTNHPCKWKLWGNHNKSKKVSQYDLQWNFIKTWDSMIDITRELHIAYQSIWANCIWRRKSAWWFIWKYFIN